MSIRAWIYTISVICAGCILGISAFLQPSGDGPQLAFALLVLMATAAQVLKCTVPGHHSYHPALMFFFAGVILLSPLMFVLLVLVAHAIEWAIERLLTKSDHLRAWYIQPFNMAMHVLAGLASQTVYDHIASTSRLPIQVAPVAAATLAAILYVLLNHLLVGQALVLARKVPWRQSGLLRLENLLTDLVILLMGSILALALAINPWYLLPALSSFYLIYRGLSVPSLKLQANTDPKTGLWNGRYFTEILEAELQRSRRSCRPLTVIMADLDLLRNINNTFGHLAGDAVLVCVANTLKQSFREYDVVARFGGEEFAILMPEVTPQDAYGRIESIRRAIEATDIQSPTSQALIRTTMSFGIAGYDSGEMTAKEIIHRADIAVYQSKVKGRNRTCIFSEEAAYSLGIFQYNSSNL